MSEIRQNKATKQWVIYAPARRKRPQDFQETRTDRKNLPVLDKECPFCPGNEHMLSKILMEMPDEQNCWHTRVILNKFPALTADGDSRRFTQGIQAAPGGLRSDIEPRKVRFGSSSL